MITLEKRDLHARRRCQLCTYEVADVREENEAIVVESALQKLFNDIALVTPERQGGYTRIWKLNRRGDNRNLS